MGRNIERDEREERQRKDRLINAGFELFSAKGIETVSLNAVADKADVGVATLYKYYKNKINLVIEISTRMWSEVWKDILKSSNKKLLQMNVYDLIEYYCDSIIRIFNEKPQILKFSANYKTFINREEVSKEQYSGQIEALNPIRELFHQKYAESQSDKLIRNDIPEEELFTYITITMLSMAERYVQGIVWADMSDRKYSKELIRLKEMILEWIKS